MPCPVDSSLPDEFLYAVRGGNVGAQDVNTCFHYPQFRIVHVMREDSAVIPAAFDGIELVVQEVSHASVNKCHHIRISILQDCVILYRASSS